MLKAVIFDFNGTLFFDRDINIEGWKLFYQEFFGKTKGAKEFAEQAILRNNRCNVEAMLKEKGVPVSEKEINELARHKEDFYHELIIKENRHSLAPGADKVLNYFKEKNLKLNLCTASIKYNLDFYFEQTNLGNWFIKEKAAYDDGVCINKIEMYKKAATNIKVEPQACLVFEDSKKGIEDAKKAGYHNFIYVNHYGLAKIQDNKIIKEIKEYAELDISFLNNLL